MHAIPIDWQTIHTVFLDMDGTLLDLHFDNHFWLEHLPKRYSEKNHISYKDASNLLMKHSDSTYGSLDWYCLDHWSEKFDIDVVALKHEVADKIAIRENVISFLTYLKGLNKRVVLLTNAHRKSCKVKFNYVEIEAYFNKVITSHDIGLAKEEEGFWQALNEYENYDKNHSLFIDDNYDVLDNANKFGVKHLLTISKPDSRKPFNTSANYIAIDDFQQLMC